MRTATLAILFVGVLACTLMSGCSTSITPVPPNGTPVTVVTWGDKEDAVCASAELTQGALELMGVHKYEALGFISSTGAVCFRDQRKLYMAWAEISDEAVIITSDLEEVPQENGAETDQYLAKQLYGKREKRLPKTLYGITAIGAAAAEAGCTGWKEVQPVGRKDHKAIFCTGFSSLGLKKMDSSQLQHLLDGWQTAGCQILRKEHRKANGEFEYTYSEFTITPIPPKP